MALSSFDFLVSLTAFRNRRRTIHSILSLVARFPRPVQNKRQRSLAWLLALVTIAASRFFLFFLLLLLRLLLFLLFFRSSPVARRERVQSAQTRARVCVHARPRARDNKCFSSMFYACACVCCSSLKSISRPSLCSGVLSLFFFLLFNPVPFSYTHTLKNNFDKKKMEEEQE